MNRSRSFMFDSLEPRTMLSAQVIGYLPDYQRARMTGATPTVGQPDWSALTQINYFSLRPEQLMVMQGNPPAFVPPAATSSGFNLAMMDQTVAEAHTNGVKVNLVIGGADLGDQFPTIAASSNDTATFITNLKTFAAAHNFDGVDLDWEPRWETATHQQITDFGNLLIALNAAAPALQISAAVAPEPVPVDPTDTAPREYVIPQNAVGALDYINVMAYDFDLGAQHSPIVRSENAMAGWATWSGLPHSRIVMGLPFYGRSAAAWNQLIDYDDIVKNFGPQTTDSTNGWFFNGRATIQTKSQYVMNNGYGGVMMWDISQDYFTAGLQYDPNISLLPVIKATIIGNSSWATLSNGVLTANGTGGDDTFTVAVNGSNLSIALGSAALTYPLSSITSITINGTGGDDTLEFNGPLAKPIVFNGGSGFDTLNVNSGTYTFNADAGLGNDALVVNVAAGAAVVFNSTQHLDGLNVLGTATAAASGSRVLTTAGLSLGAAAKIDLNDNDLIVDYTTLNPSATIRSLINTGRANGAWTGNGITSTSAKNANPKITTLGLMSSSEFKGIYGATATFDGQTIDTTAVLVKYTYYGDTDFNGVVNFDDYSRTDAGFNNHLTGWLNGDFDGNGQVDFDDYSLIDLAFNTHGAALRPLVASPGAGKGSGFARPALI